MPNQFLTREWLTKEDWEREMAMWHARLTAWRSWEHAFEEDEKVRIGESISVRLPFKWVVNACEK